MSSQYILIICQTVSMVSDKICLVNIFSSYVIHVSMMAEEIFTPHLTLYIAGNSVWLRRQMDSWFQSLEMLILMSYEDNLPSMSIHSGLLKSVLMAAKSLSVLNLEGNFGSIFSDSYFSEIVTENPLSSLRILDICVNDQQGQVGRIPLTLTTVQLLLSKCHCLRELRISDWSISSQQFAEVMGVVKENNWDLVVTRRVVAEGD